MLHPLPLPLSSCLGCIPRLVGQPFLRFYAVAASLFLLFVSFCLCFLFVFFIVTMSFAGYFLVRSPLSSFPAYFQTYFRFGLVWFRLSCDHGWIRSGSVHVRYTFFSGLATNALNVRNNTQVICIYHFY